VAGGRRAGAGSQTWSPEFYQRHASFVAELGADIFSWLAPQPDEDILDLGCGDGALTERIARAGARVVGIDASADMVKAARARGLDARQGSGESLDFDGAFDAVFSNAALHWMHDAAAVARGVARALRKGGRFVAELGGHTNVASVVTALQAARLRFGGAPGLAMPWYFPSEAEYAAVLRDAGLEPVRSALVPRPTPLPSGMVNWLETFVHPYLDEFAGERRREVVDYVVALLEPSLRDRAGNWTADYVRLRIEALRLQ
jgi:trans-aconitate methyltransferase